jgi:hypothetical protein
MDLMIGLVQLTTTCLMWRTNGRIHPLLHGYFRPVCVGRCDERGSGVEGGLGV